jgi:hypothetical protein
MDMVRAQQNDQRAIEPALFEAADKIRAYVRAQVADWQALYTFAREHGIEVMDETARMRCHRIAVTGQVPFDDNEVCIDCQTGEIVDTFGRPVQTAQWVVKLYATQYEPTALSAGALLADLWRNLPKRP